MNDYLKPLSDDIIKKVLNLFPDLNAKGQKSWLQLICELLSDPSETITFLVNNGVWDIVQDSMMDWSKNLSKEALRCLHKLSLAPLDDLIKIFDSGVLSLLFNFMRSSESTHKISSIKCIINILKSADHQMWMDLFNDWYLKEIREWLGPLNHQDTNYWALWAIYEFLSKDDNRKTFINDFKEIGGNDALEKLRDNCPNYIHDKICSILTRYYWDDDDVELFDSMR